MDLTTLLVAKYSPSEDEAHFKSRHPDVQGDGWSQPKTFPSVKAGKEAGKEWSRE